MVQVLLVRELYLRAFVTRQLDIIYHGVQGLMVSGLFDQLRQRILLSPVPLFSYLGKERA